MDYAVSASQRDSAPRWLPWAVGALLVGAVASLAVALLPDWYQLFGPYLIVDADLVVDAFGSIAQFVLPAAVLVGSGRWAAGRRWLWWGAGALSVLAVTSLAREAWFAAVAAWPDSVSFDVPGAWAALWLGGAAGLVAGNALLAVGLASRAGSTVPAIPSVIRATSVLVAMLSLLVVVVSAATAFVIPWNGIEFALLAIGGGLLLAVAYGALGVVAIVALRSMPPADALPELLIAVGATAAMLGGAGIWVMPYLVPSEVPEIVFGFFTALSGLSVAGVLVMAAGFALGRRVSVRSEAAVSAA